MPLSEAPMPRFRPDRPIYLNTENTGFKTADEVFLAVGKLRERHWLCVFNEKINKPFHLSFTSESELQEFKKTCAELKIVLKSPVIKADDLEEMEALENASIEEPKSSVEKITLK